MIIKLSWPVRALFPNNSNRKNGFYPRVEAAQAYRQEGFTQAFNSGEALEKARNYVITYDFYPPVDSVDHDGCISAMKSAVDGIFDYLKRSDKKISDNRIKSGYFEVHQAGSIPGVVITLSARE